MPSLFTEDTFEQAVIELFEHMGYAHIYAPDMDRDYTSPLLDAILRDSLVRINKNLTLDAIDEAISKLKYFDAGSLIQKNMLFMDYLQNGIEVSYQEKGETKSTLVYLVDYENVSRNSFIAANQWTYSEYETKRPDIVIFLNGLPVVVMELKSPKADTVTIEEAYAQIRNYMKSIESMFIYNAFCVISDQSQTRAGTITASFDRFMEWKTVDGDYEETQYADFTTLLNGMFTKSRFLDILHNFICFSKETGGDAKILAAYHQYFAVKKAVESTVKASAEGGDGRGGVFWHTQGSGKSLSMVFYVKQLQTSMNSPTVVVITDRNDLDDQLFAQFAKCKDFLRQTPVQAEKRKLSDEEIQRGSKTIGLSDWLGGREANGIIFTTMQKFEESDEPLCTRRNIVVMADEAHRSQYGFEERVNPKTGKITIGNARRVRDALPNATYIGFTGTPIELEDRNTLEVFGNYIDIYDMTQAVADGATRPIYYESRVIKLELDPEILKKIDETYEQLKENANEVDIEKSKHELAHMDGVLGTPKVIDSLCKDIIEHYETYRQYEQSGKAMIVAYSRPMAIKIYHRLLDEDMRPEWKDKIKLVMTGSNKDPEEWKQYTGNKAYREGLAREFKDNNSEFKIAIVVDMWLTGFDVPSMSTMYIFKPMKGHNLMQAIARVNRVFEDKEGGLIVDYVGIASALKEAMNDYTTRDKKNYGDTDVAKVAYPKFVEKLSVCRDLFHGYDYSKFISGTDLERSKAISGAVNFIVGVNKERERELFLKEAIMLRQALSLCSSMVEEDLRVEAAFFESVRVLVMRLIYQGEKKKFSLQEINERINGLLKQSVKSEGVISLFSDVGEEFSLFDPKFLEELSKMKEKNLAVELLKKLIAEQVQIYRRTNVVKSEKFSEIIQSAMNRYLNGMLTNEEVIQELLKIAKEIADAQKEGDELGLTADELAFYDALTKPQAIKDFYENEELIAITKELAETLRKNRTIDWQKRDSARAKMRMIVKKLLKKHRYPPEGMEDAVQTVITQCELWTDNADYSESRSAESDSSYKPVQMATYVHEPGYGEGMVAETTESNNN